MKSKYQNAFFAFGVILLAIMATQLDFRTAWEGLKDAGRWFPAVLLLWAFLYALNTATWYIIIRNVPGERPRIGFAWLYKITVSGFALNYATPGGLMGGEPYRIMSLSPLIGPERASSSVILYVMTHIFSHFLFWMLAILLYIATEPLTMAMGVLLAVAFAFCSLGIWFFMRGYRKGLAMSAMRLLGRLPWVGKWATGFISGHRGQLDTIDGQIAALHRQNRKAFLSAVGLEFLCRVCSSLEIMFCLMAIMPGVSFVRCIMILAFTSLFANLLFFMPLQLGGREGGFMMSTGGLAMTASAGIFVALIVRIRELAWTAVGLLMIKLERRR